MPAKTREHEIRNISENQFEAFINFLKWEVSPPTHDYGLDYWGEVFTEGNPTGDIFRVQLKGTETLASYYTKTKHVYSYSIPIEKLRQWFGNVVPVYFVLWDIVEQIGYWVHVQTYIQDKLSTNPEWLKQKNKRQERTIHMLPANKIKVDHADNFIQNLDAHIERMRNADEVNTFIETIRGVSWTDMRKQLQHIKSTDEYVYVIHSERIMAIDLTLKSDPENLALLVEKANLHYEQNQFDMALQSINKAYSIDQTSKAILSLRGCILCEYARNKKNEPRRFFIEAIENFEQSADFITSASLHYNIGNCYDGLRDHKKAIEHFDLSLKEPMLPDLEAQVWKNRGTSFFHLSNHDEEKANYLKAIELNPQLWEAYGSLATTLIQFDEFDTAEEILEIGITFVPHYSNTKAQAYYLLAFTKWKLQKDVEALALVNHVLEVLPNNKDAYFLKAHLLMVLWRKDESYIEKAKRFFGTWVLAEPDNVLAKGELHLIYKSIGDIEQARQVITEAITENDNIPAMIFYDYAMMLQDDGKLDDAIEYLHKAASIEINHAIEHKLGHLYLYKKDYQNALHWYQQALASTTDFQHMLLDIATCQYFLDSYEESAISVMELLLFDPYHTDHWTKLAISMKMSGYSDEFDAMSLFLDDVKTPEELAELFDRLIEKIEPDKKQKWLLFKQLQINNKSNGFSEGNV